jgi:hypothetical protein
MLSPGLLTVIVGALSLAWAQWYMPHVMPRIRSGMIQRGRSVSQLDAMLVSRRYRLVLLWMKGVGLFGIVAGVVLLIVGE